MAHTYLRYDVALVDDGFAVYVVRVEGMPVKVDDLVTYLVGTYNDDTFIAEAERMIHRKGLQATFVFFFEV